MSAERSARRMLAAVFVTFAAHGSATASDHPHDRSGVYFGAGLGSGSARVEQADESAGRGGGSTADLRIGQALDPAWLLGFEATAYYRRLEDETTFLLSSLLVATWFPRAGGAFARFGLGLARARFDPGGVDREHGTALYAAAGYEWRLTPGFAFSPQLEINRLNLRGVLDRANTVVVMLQGTWY